MRRNNRRRRGYRDITRRSRRRSTFPIVPTPEHQEPSMMHAPLPDKANDPPPPRPLGLPNFGKLGKGTPSVDTLFKLLTSAQWPRLWNGFLTIRSTVKTLNQSLLHVEKLMDSAHQVMGLANSIWSKKKGGGISPKLPIPNPKNAREGEPNHKEFGNLFPNLPLSLPHVSSSGDESTQSMPHHTHKSHETDASYSSNNKPSGNGDFPLPDPKSIMRILQSPMVQQWISQWVSQNKEKG